jgi:hypothetical protein
MILGVITCFLVSSAVRLSVAGDDRITRKMIAEHMISITLSEIATAAFFLLLMIIATGFCITSDRLGPHRSWIQGMPLGYVLVSIASAAIIMHFEGNEVFINSPSVEAPKGSVKTLILVLATALLARITFVILIWTFIISSIEDQMRALDNAVRSTPMVVLPTELQLTTTPLGREENAPVSSPRNGPAETAMHGSNQTAKRRVGRVDASRAEERSMEMERTAEIDPAGKCSLNVHRMFTEYLLNVHYMFTERSLNVH